MPRVPQKDTSSRLNTGPNPLLTIEELTPKVSTLRAHGTSHQRLCAVSLIGRHPSSDNRSPGPIRDECSHRGGPSQSSTIPRGRANATPGGRPEPAECLVNSSWNMCSECCWDSFLAQLPTSLTHPLGGSCNGPEPCRSLALVGTRGSRIRPANSLVSYGTS